jgi:hypothetical protein
VTFGFAAANEGPHDHGHLDAGKLRQVSKPALAEVPAQPPWRGWSVHSRSFALRLQQAATLARKAWWIA